MEMGEIRSCLSSGGLAPIVERRQPNQPVFASFSSVPVGLSGGEAGRVGLISFPNITKVAFLSPKNDS
jgi:hypothetical protein